MRFVFILGLIVTSLNLFGQSDLYYWYKDKKVPLKAKEHKKFILYESQNEDQIITYGNKYPWRIVKKGRDNSINSIDNSEKNKKDLSWIVIEKGEINGHVDSLSRQALYISPFFINQDGKEVGVSHLFYVKLKRAGDISLLEEFADLNSVEILGKNKFMPLWYTLTCNKHSKGNSLEMANLFYESGRFDSSEPDLMVDKLVECVNDDYFSDQWNLNNTAQYGGTNGTDIHVCEAWDLVTGCNNITVAVLDHGFEMNHPDLTNISALSYDASTGTSPSLVRGSHGTACAGIIGASADNDHGVAGVASGCQLMSISHTLTLTINARQELADGINWAWQNGADVISNSWGHNSLAGNFIDDAITNALTFGRDDLGCVIVFATGNDNGSVQYPANSNPDIIAVGAMSMCGERKNPSSCDGEDWGSNYGNELDVVAPGVLIPTTDRQGNNGYNPNTEIHPLNGGSKVSNDYDDDDYTIWFNGTSSACPQVAGVAALILSVNPSLAQDEVRDIIESTCTKVGSYSYSTVTGRTNGIWNNQMGYGLVNAYAAVNQASGGNITGPSVVCYSGNSTFSLTGPTTGLTIDWDCDTSVLTQVGDDDGSSYMVTANMWNTGESWVRANIITACGDTIVKQVTFQVGEPVKNDFHFVMLNISTGEYVSNLTNNDGNPTELCPNTIYELWTDYYGPFTIQDLGWDLPPDWEIQAQYGSSNRFTTYLAVNDNVNTGLFLTVQTEECGWGNMLPGFYFTEDYSCGSYYLLITPNPSTFETTVSIGSYSEKQNFDETAEWDLEVYDRGQMLKTKKPKLKSRAYTINTSNWKEGVYIVRANYNGEVITGKLVVKE